MLGGIFLFLATLPCCGRREAKSSASQPDSESEEEPAAQDNANASVV